MSRSVELGPWLNRLVAPPAPVSAAEALLSELRLRLLTRLFENPDWSGAWHQAVEEAGALISAEIEARLRDAAAASRYPARKLRTVLLDHEARGILAARLSAAGIGLEEHLNETTDPSEGAMRMLCGKLEVAWSRLVTTADQDLEKAERKATTIRAWRRPLLPFLIASGALLAFAVWTGLVLGGYIDSPGWFRPIAELVWR